MSNNNLRANRQVCDVMIYEKATGKPFMFIDFANSTGIQVSGDSSHAMAKGRKRISFQNPMENTITLEYQCFPFKLLSLYSDGKIKNDSVTTEKLTVNVPTGGEVDITLPEGASIVEGTIFAFEKGCIGDENKVIGIAWDGSTKKATLTAKDGGTLPAEADIIYMLKRTKGVSRIDINDDALAIDVAMEMKTLDKTEDGSYVPLEIKIHKATIQRNFELTFASEGDPASIAMTFDVLDTDEGNIELIELED